MNTNILIVGLGLIGGSYARALSKKGYRVSAIDTDADSIRYALDHGLIVSGKNPESIREYQEKENRLPVRIAKQSNRKMLLYQIFHHRHKQF